MGGGAVTRLLAYIYLSINESFKKRKRGVPKKRKKRLPRTKKEGRWKQTKTTAVSSIVN